MESENTHNCPIIGYMQHYLQKAKAPEVSNMATRAGTIYQYIDISQY